MIGFSGTSPDQAERDFREWASSHPDGLFMKLSAYIDESGTHDQTGRRPGSDVAIMGGIIGPLDTMANLSRQWRFILNKYHADEFHTWQWRDACYVADGKPPSSNFKENPYKGWSSQKLLDFRMELAHAIGDGDAIPFGGNLITERFYSNKLSGDFPADANPYSILAVQMFNSLTVDVVGMRPSWKHLPIACFSECTSDHTVYGPIQEAFNKAKAQDARFKSITFGDKQQYLLLQAADLLVSHYRRDTSNFHKSPNSEIASDFHEALFKQVFRAFDNNPDYRKLVGDAARIVFNRQQQNES